jgi:nitrile hydratase beta subunit
VNGPHDMGGGHGFGPVQPEADEPPFHAAWERRAFALTLAMGATGQWNIDQSRFAREGLPPADYLRFSYYRLWVEGLQRLLLARGLVSAPELAAGRAIDPARPLPNVLRAAEVDATLARGGPAARPGPRPARFAVGDRVRARNIHPPGHTRLPRYLRGHAGVIERVHGCHVFPDSRAHDLGDDPQWLYSVCFQATDLWGPAHGDPTATVNADAFEPYLEPA